MAPQSDETAYSGLKVLHREVLTWTGIVTTAFSIFSNAGAVIEFARTVRFYAEQWRELVASLVNWLAGLFQVEFDQLTAVIVFSVLSCGVIALTSQGNRTAPWTKPFRLVGWIAAAVLGSLYLGFVVLEPTTSDPRMEDETRFLVFLAFLINLAAAALVFMPAQPERNRWRIACGVLVFVILLTIGPIIRFGDNLDQAHWTGLAIQYGFFGLMSATVIAMYYVANPIQMTLRSSAILVILGFLFALNQVALAFE